MFTTTDADGKKVKIASTVDGETGEHTIAVAGGGGGEGSGQVEVTNFPETQPVSGPLTDAELRATPVPVSVDFPETQPVSGPLTAAELATAALATAANQGDILTVLGNILTELQTANGHLATIAANTEPDPA